MITGGKTPDIGSRTFTEIMREQLLKGEETEVCNDNFKFYKSLINVYMTKLYIIHIPPISDIFF